LELTIPTESNAPAAMEIVPNMKVSTRLCREVTTNQQNIRYTFAQLEYNKYQSRFFKYNNKSVADILAAPASLENQLQIWFYVFLSQTVFKNPSKSKVGFEIILPVPSTR
jgi:hypothetical protein